MVFLCCTFQICFVLQEAYLQLKCRYHRRALNNDIGNFMVCHFYLIDN